MESDPCVCNYKQCENAQCHLLASSSSSETMADHAHGYTKLPELQPAWPNHPTPENAWEGRMADHVSGYAEPLEAPPPGPNNNGHWGPTWPNDTAPKDECWECLEQQTATRKVEARCRQLTFDLQQCEKARVDLLRTSQEDQRQLAEVRNMLEFQEASKEHSERRVGDGWRTIQQLAELVHSMRIHFDGPNLSSEEKKVDIAHIIMERERLQHENGGLKQMMAEAQTNGRKLLDAERLRWELAIRSKDQKIAELKRLSRPKLDLHRRKL